MHISKLCDACARDSPKELGDSQKLSEVKLGRNVHEFDDFPAGLHQVDVSNIFHLPSDQMSGCITNRSQSYSPNCNAFNELLIYLLSVRENVIVNLDGDD